MVAAKLNSNAWYLVSETRVTKVTDTKYGNNLQTTNAGLRVFALVGQAWQFQPVDDIDGRYLMRVNTSGVRDQMSVCYVADEQDTSKTQACMRSATSDDSQKWDISEWGDGSFKFQNVANGSNYVLDVHPGSNLFMSGNIEGQNGVSAQVAQHWVMSSERAVNDGAYSTIYTAGTTATSTPSTTATGTSTGTRATGTAADATGTSATSAATSSAAAESASSGGLSSGAAAGIGVGVSLAAVALLGAAFFFWWRRRKAAKGTAVPQSEQHHELGQDGPGMAKLSPNTMNASTVGSPSTYNEYYGQEAKVLGHMQPHAHAAEAGHTPIYEAPVDTRYELDSGNGAPASGPGAPAQLPDDNTRR